MNIRHIVRGGATIGLIAAATHVAWAKVDTTKLVLHSAHRTGPETSYTFTGTFDYSFTDGEYTFVATYESTVTAHWNPLTKEATEHIAFSRTKFEAGQVAATFECSGDPFVAVPGAGPLCQQKNLQISLNYGKGEYWPKILKDDPLTYRRADPAQANTMFAKSSSANPPPPPPSPAPNPDSTRRPNASGGTARTIPSTFANPTWQGTRVDYCLHWGTACGQPAADEFCRRSGFARSTASTLAQKVGPTLVLGDSQTCDGTRCDGFASISCAK
jgi:hypothetical protein